MAVKRYHMGVKESGSSGDYYPCIMESADGDLVQFKDMEARLTEVEKQNVENLEQIDKEHAAALAEREKEIARLKGVLTGYDRWLSGGVYYTNEDFEILIAKRNEERVKAKQAYADVLKEAVKMAGWILDDPDCKLVHDEMKAFLDQHKTVEGK